MNQLLIAKYLQLLRRQYGYTQDGLAAELNISRQAVSKWETGNNIPDLEVLLKISKLAMQTSYNRHPWLNKPFSAIQAENCKVSYLED